MGRRWWDDRRSSNRRAAGQLQNRLIAETTPPPQPSVPSPTFSCACLLSLFLKNSSSPTPLLAEKKKASTSPTTHSELLSSRSKNTLNPLQCYPAEEGEVAKQRTSSSPLPLDCTPAPAATTAASDVALRTVGIFLDSSPGFHQGFRQGATQRLILIPNSKRL